MDGITALLLLLLGAVVYLIYKVNRLEDLVSGGGRHRRRPAGDSKVIPILKEHIEPGPFKPEQQPKPPEPEA